MLRETSQLWQCGCVIEMFRYRDGFREDFLRAGEWKSKSNGERLLLCVEGWRMLCSCLRMRCTQIWLQKAGKRVSGTRC